MIGAWETVSRALINRTTDEFEVLAKKGLSTAQAYEELSQQRFLCTRIHTRLYMVKNFYERIAEEGTEFTKEPLTRLANLYAFWSVEEEAGIFLREGYITPQELKYISAEIRKQLLEVRKDVIGYTDAFNVPDFSSTLPLDELTEMSTRTTSRWSTLRTLPRPSTSLLRVCH